MFSKTETNQKREWSITFRLAWIYSLSAFAMLVIATFTLYWILNGSLERENFQFLQYKAAIWKKILENNPQNIEHVLRNEVLLEEKLYHNYTRIIDEKGHILLETPGMSGYVPTYAYANILAQNSNIFLTMQWRSPKDRKLYILMSAYIRNQDHPNQYHYIELARDISTERGIIINYRRGILLILLMGVIVSAGIGIVVTRNGLRPLRSIIQTTKHITASQMQERLDPLTWPKELSDLAIAFNSMLDRIEQGFNRLTQFSGDLAHELRTPINNLMGTAEIALGRARSNEEYKEVLESIFEEFERLSNMIESLLFLAHAENPETAIHYASIDLNKLMQDLSEFYEAVAEDKKVSIRYEGHAVLQADPLMLRRVLTNLISNALKYTPDGGEILLKAYEDKEGHILISVKDSGIGILPANIPHLFNRFYRVDSARSQHTGGTGLGLAIVKFIMDLHKGHVDVQSELGKGTLVTLFFPPFNSPSR